MNQTLHRSRIDTSLLSRPKFFWFVVAVLVIQAAWIALTSHYPMAFDEDFHLGIIKIYAHHLSPFLSSQPPSADTFGAVARDPSYLYQYLMSFVYRIIGIFTQNQTAIVLVLRCVNIGLFAGSLVVYRKLLGTFAPAAVTNGVLLFFVFIPVAPLLAAQINYDNLFIPVVGLTLLVTIKFVHKLSHEKSFSWRQLMIVAALVLFGSLIKYAFLPVALMVGLFCIVYFVKTRSKLVYSKPEKSLWFIALSVVLAILAVLFSQRYIVNIIDYKTPIPSCSQVLTVEQCSHYGPWIRDYNFELNKIDHAHNDFAYTLDWLNGMWLRLYFAVDGPASQYQTRGPLPIPGMTGIIAAAVAGIGIIIGGKRLLGSKNKTIILLVSLTTAVYVAVLFIDNYRAYARTGQPVAINGRYLLPFLPILLALGAIGYQRIYANHKNLILGAAIALLIGGIYGGGMFTYILRSNDGWYWHNQAVYDANHAVKTILGPVTPGYNEPTEYLN